jgi:hypothetical protein
MDLVPAGAMTVEAPDAVFDPVSPILVIYT